MSEPLEFIVGPQEGPQTIALGSDVDELLYGGALGGGKTYFLLLDFLYHSDRYGNTTAIKGIVFRKSFPELADIIDKSKDVMPKLGWIWKAGDHTWVHPNGAQWRLRFIERDTDVDKYWGHEYTWMAVDELGQWKAADFAIINKLKARLRSPHGVKTRFVATANPGGNGHKPIKERYIDPAPPMTVFHDPVTGKSMMFVPAKLEDNRILMQSDPNYHRTIEGIGPAWLVKALRHGDWNIAPDGNVFVREYFQHRYRKDQLPLNFLYVVSSLDTAFKKGRDRSNSACITIGATETHFYILDAWRDQVEFPRLKQKCKDINSAYNPDEMIVENKASGISLVQDLRDGTRIPIKEFSGDDDKLARAYSTTGLWDSAKILLPADAPWVNDYVEEMCRYPVEPDDQVDATTQGLMRLRNRLERLQRFRPTKKQVIPFSIYQR